MKIYFYTDRPTSRSAQKVRRKAGRGSSKVARAIDSIVAGEEVRVVATRSVKVEDKKRVNLTKDQMRQKNDAEFQRLESQGELLEKMSFIFNRTAEVAQFLEQANRDVERARAYYIERYREIYKKAPRAKSIQSEHKDAELAKFYVQFVMETGVASPRQSDLDEYSGIDQSTWSRAFKKMSFWEEVNRKLQNVWNMNPIIEKKMRLILEENRRELDSNLELRTTKHGKKIYSPSNEVENATLDGIDLGEISTMKRHQVIREIMKTEANFSQSGFDEKYTDEQLRALLFFLTRK